MKRVFALFLLALGGCRSALPLTFDAGSGTDRAALTEPDAALVASHEYWDDMRPYSPEETALSAAATPR
jgi:hypothetical protein